MSVKATNYVLHHTFGNPTRKLIMLAIADHANDSGEAWPAVDTLAFKAECSYRSAQIHLAHLEQHGHLQIQPPQGRRITNLYRIIFKNTPPEIIPRRPRRDTSADSAPPQILYTDSYATRTSSCLETSPESSLHKEPSKERENPHPKYSRSLDMDQYADAMDGVTAARPEWNLPFSAAERKAFAENCDLLAAITPPEWETIRRYLAARHPEGSGAYTPKSRERFIRDISDIRTHALDWDRKQRPARPPRPKPLPTEPEGEPMTPEEVKAYFASLKTA